MDKQELQQKIAEYFEKLSPEAQKVFSEMKWLEILKEISLKFNLTDEQIETLGTETMLVLLGIIHLDEYKNILKEEMKLERTEQIFSEINDKILKNINKELEDTFYKNNYTENEIDERFNLLSEKTKDAIKKSNYQNKVYEIGKRFGLTIYEIGLLGEATINVILGKTPPEKFGESLEFLKTDKEKINKIVNDINEEILKKIREELIKGTIENREDLTKIESREEMLKNIENPKSITNYELRTTNYKKETKPETEEEAIKIDLTKQKELPEGPHPILMQKLSNAFKMESKETEHSLENITKSGDTTTYAKGADPYREMPV